MRPEVAFYLPSLKGGGAERCMLNLAKGIAAKGFCVSLVVAREEGAHVEEAREAIPIIDLGCSGVWNSIPLLAPYLARERPTVLISALDHANLAALIAKRLAVSRVRVIVTTHTVVSKAIQVYRPQVAWLMRRLMRRMYPTADHVVVVSKSVGRDLCSVVNIPEESVEVVYNPVEISKVIALSRSVVDSPWLGRSQSPLILSVGNLWRHKDHQMLVRAVKIARRRGALRLAILGEGTERKALETLTSNLNLGSDVLLPGFVMNPYAWMARSAVFALSSQWEGLPTVLLEAMACGVTPVATDSPGGTAEILDDGRYGILTPVGDTQAMADALVRSLDRPFPASALQKRASEFSVDRAVQRYVELIQNLS